MLLHQLFSIYYKWKKIKKSYKNNKFKISAPTSNKKFELPDGLYFVSDYFEYILKNMGKRLITLYTDNPIKIYANKIENRIIFKIKTGYYLERLTPETMKLRESTKNKIIKDENGENVHHLEIIEVVLVHCNIFNNDYQQDLRVLYTFVPNESFGRLLDISPQKFIFLRTFDSEFSYIEG